jgi:precorrin-6B methylase 2
MSSYTTISGHRFMAFDAVRNLVYARALEAVVRPESVVLDLGAGTGVHGLMAARLGARRVYLVEREDFIALAEENVRANGLADVVRCVQGRIEDVEIPEKIDIIVSALTGNFLLTEDLLPSLFVARDRYLKPGGVLVPDAAIMEVVPVSAPAFHEREIACWSMPQFGVDLSAGRKYAANAVVFRAQDANDMIDLAHPSRVHSLDFHTSNYEPLKTDIDVTISHTGVCHGWLGWFKMRLGAEWLTTSPRSAHTHWSWAFLPLDPPLTVEEGEQVRLRLARAPYGDWLWTTRARGGAQQHSTLFAVPMKAETVQKAGLEYRPVLTDEGSATAYVLSQCDGSRSAGEIAESVRTLYPGHHWSSAEALRFVQALVKRHA